MNSEGIKSKVKSSWAKIVVAISPVREFLEASTLHGLVYISRSETVWGKVLWGTSVLLSLSCAGVLISDSFAGWAAHPVSTVISTHPIKDLKFPNVTICPPKDTDTAINYDLFMLKDHFTPSQKDAMTKEINDVFFDKETETYVKTLSEIVNDKNLVSVYKGFQAIPTHANQKGYTVRLSGHKGEIFARPSENYDNIHYILDFPDNLEELIGATGKLIVELRHDMNSSKLEYLGGPVFLAPSWDGIGQSWHDAVDKCKEMGAKLATVSSKLDNDELLKAMKKIDAQSFWIGGRTNNIASPNWTWVDGSKWNFEDWHWYSTYTYDPKPNREGTQCLFVQSNLDGTWYTEKCNNSIGMSFICQYEPEQIVGTEKTLSYSKKDIPKGGLHFWWKNDIGKSYKVNPDEASKYFFLSWRIENKYPNLELVSTQLSGNVQTPDFGEDGGDEFYLGDRSSTLTLELPDSSEMIVGNGTFIVNLIVVTESGEGWKEEVIYSDGPVFKYNPERKTWPEAENTCFEAGTHLASVLSWRERDELIALGEQQLWIGGTFNGNWTWTDGEIWEVTSWDKENGYPKQESRNTKLAFFKSGESGLWKNYNSRARFPFVCKAIVKMTGVQNRTWEYTADDLKNTKKVAVQWKYWFPGQDVLAKYKRPRKTGFNMTWYVEDQEGQRIEIPITDEERWSSKYDLEAIFTTENENFVAFVNLAQHALEENIDHTSMLIQLKDDITSAKLGLRGYDCQLGQTTSYFFDNHRSFKFIANFNLTYDTTIHKHISTVALKNGFELYTTLLHCPSHKYVDLYLQEFFRNISSPRVLLQGALNMINSGQLKEPVSKDHLYQFCKEIQSILGLNLKAILPMMLTSDGVSMMTKENHPFMDHNLISDFAQKSSDNSESANREALMAELSSHPVHLKTKSGKVLPSAFIPFCAYKTDLLLLGEYIEGLDFPVCNKFTPTLLDGQLCYAMDINSALPDSETLDGKDGELLLLLDYNKERSVGFKRSKKNNGSSKRYISMKGKQTGEEEEARVFIHTLKPFSGFGAGRFSMSSLKRMVPTDNFRKLPPTTTGCANDELLFQHGCQLTKYWNEKLQTCKCIPWEFPQTLINTKRSATKCLSKGRDCYAKLEEITCRVDCEGLYADVVYDNSTEEEDTLVLENMIQAYNAFKYKYVPNLVLAKRYGIDMYTYTYKYAIEIMDYHPLQVVQIYFSTATYDKIENDVSVTLGDQISAIGGTMGLFAGFSILSAVEVLYFVMKFLFAFLSQRRQSACCCGNA